MFLDEDFEILVDNGDSEQNTSTRSDGTQEVSHNRESTNAQTTEGSGSGDVTVETLLHLVITMSSNDHLLFTELTGNITSRRTRNLDPSLGEEGTGTQHKGQVEESVERIREQLSNSGRRRDVISKSTNRDSLGLSTESTNLLKREGGLKNIDRVDEGGKFANLLSIVQEDR